MKPMANNGRFRLSGISLKSQLILSFVAVTLTVLSVTSYYSYQKTLDILENKTRDTSLAQFRQIETNIRTLMHEVDKLSNTFQLESDVQIFLQSGRMKNEDFVPIEQEITKLITYYFGNYDYLDSIYLFTDNGMVIGGSQRQNQSTTVVGKEYPFFTSSLYKNIISYPKTMWSGGLTSTDFMRLPLANTNRNNNLISALRGVKWIYASRMSAVLAFNIKERHLNLMYGDLRSGTDGSINVIDQDGTIISSTREDSIRKRYSFSEQLKPGSNIGSFETVRDEVKEQVLYYRMSEPGWTLTEEVPLKLYTQDTVAIQRFTAAVFALSVILIVALSSLWMSRIMGSLQELIKGMRNVGRGNIGLTLTPGGASNKEIGQLTEQFNRMSTGILELITRNEEAEKEKRRLEMEALQSQINPHFLFNTLNTVKWMAAVSGAKNIMECVTNLGNMLRPIYKNPKLLWSIEEEIEFVKNYANIMNFRYGEEVEFRYDVPAYLLKCQTLRFMIQPSIENALIHGKSGKGVIEVTVSETIGVIVIKVTDTRGGMPRDKADEVNRTIRAQGADRESKGIGLSNIDKRIRLHFGDRYGVGVESEEGVGTRVSMKIPMLQEDETVQIS